MLGVGRYQRSIRLIVACQSALVCTPLPPSLSVEGNQRKAYGGCRGDIGLSKGAKATQPS